jgi:hypothetical protein
MVTEARVAAGLALPSPSQPDSRVSESILVVTTIANELGRTAKAAGDSPTAFVNSLRC